VIVSFWRVLDGQFSVWEADRGHRRIVPGTVWKEGPWGLPHDLAGLVVEADLGVADGFWSCVGAGATFKSLDRRPTKPGRQIIRAHRAHLDSAEAAVHQHVADWRAGRPTPVAPMLDRFRERWGELPAGMRLRVHWPSLETHIEPVTGVRKRRRQRFATVPSAGS
jgi:hypothetical protein